jgi:hypothetical protein
MKTYIDQSKVKTRALLSHFASLGGLFVLMAGIVIPLSFPSFPWMVVLTQIMIVAGILVSMAGIYLANRWVRRPRPEESLGEALKTLGEGYNLYHYTSLSGKHILLMPNGLMVLVIINLAGEFSYLNGRWREKINLGRIVRYIFEEHLGDPSRNVRRAVDDLKAQIRNLPGVTKPVPVSGMVVFLHPLAQLEAKGVPIPVCKVDKLRKMVVIKAPKLDPEIFEHISLFLEKSTVGK